LFDQLRSASGSPARDSSFLHTYPKYPNNVHFSQLDSGIRALRPDRELPPITPINDLFLELWGPVYGQNACSAVDRAELPHRISV
jgi:hypothetical protein